MTDPVDVEASEWEPSGGESGLVAASSSLRDFVNRVPRIRERLATEKVAWVEFCSALDVLEDTDAALGSYLQQSPVDLGGRYLATYGALQALVVQQDAVRAIVEHCGVAYPTSHERLKELRLARILSVGHPTRAGQQPGKPSSFIIQVSLRPGQFELLTVDERGRQQSRTIFVGRMILDQRDILTPILDAARSLLVSQDREHKGKFRASPLAPILEGVSYHLSKARELVHSTDAEKVQQLGQISLSMVSSALEATQKELEARGELAAHEGHVVPALNLAHHCIARISDLFGDGLKGDQDQLDAEAYGCALADAVNGLLAFLKDLDGDYASQ